MALKIKTPTFQICAKYCLHHSQLKVALPTMYIGHTLMSPITQNIIQTKTERRRREAEVEHAIGNGIRSRMYACMNVCTLLSVRKTGVTQE